MDRQYRHSTCSSRYPSKKQKRKTYDKCGKRRACLLLLAMDYFRCSFFLPVRRVPRLPVVCCYAFTLEPFHMHLTTLSFFGLLALSACTSSKLSRGNAEWHPLFNGQDLTDWVVKIQHHEVGENVGNTFRVEEGIIKVRYDQYGEFNDQFGHLYYRVPFASYHLKLEYRFVGELQRGAP
jgi:hypothetical protein